jgi:hypothetical protein
MVNKSYWTQATAEEVFIGSYSPLTIHDSQNSGMAYF